MPPQRPKNYISMSLTTILCFFWPLGIAAMVFSCMVSMLPNTHTHTHTKSKAKELALSGHTDPLKYWGAGRWPVPCPRVMRDMDFSLTFTCPVYPLMGRLFSQLTPGPHLYGWVDQTGAMWIRVSCSRNQLWPNLESNPRPFN